jgi:predicted dithiol-disulfide oxidoreductase (DUF899 family)
MGQGVESELLAARRRDRGDAAGNERAFAPGRARRRWAPVRSKLEAEYAEFGQRVTEQRRQLPWVPVETEYQFDTEQAKTLAELFDGRSQLLAYNNMFGPDYERGACPGCSNLGDELDATRVHLYHRDVTLICFRARRLIG